MNGLSQFCFHRDHSRMSKRHQEPALVFRELKPKCCFVLTRFKCLKSRELSFGSLKPRSALAQATRTLKSSVWKSVSVRCV